MSNQAAIVAANNQIDSVNNIGGQYYSPRIVGSGVGSANPHQTLSPRNINGPILNTNRNKVSRQLPRIPQLQTHNNKHHTHQSLGGIDQNNNGPVTG